MALYCLSKEHCLRQIADMLVLNGTLVDCPGLIHGKMGIAVFFFHYARRTGNGLFEDYAMDLIGEIQTQIHNNSPADYETGLAGIGVGMDYLIRNHFLDADNDIFVDFDKRMYRAVMYDPWQDFSLYDGLTGYGRYWMMRLRQQASSKQACECLLHIISYIEEKLPDIPEKEQTDVYCFLHDLYQIQGFEICAVLLEQCRKWDFPLKDVSWHFSHLGNSAVGNIARMHQRSWYFNDTMQDDNDNSLKQIPDLDMEKVPTDAGLLNGYAGEGLLRLTTLNPTNTSWMLLL